MPAKILDELAAIERRLREQAERVEDAEISTGNLKAFCDMLDKIDAQTGRIRGAVGRRYWSSTSL